MSLSFSLRKTSLAVKNQATHLKIGNYFNSESHTIISANIELPLASVSLLSLTLLPPLEKRENKELYFQLWIHLSLAPRWELVIEIFIWSERANWQIPVHLCSARAELAGHAVGGKQPQLSPGPWDSSIPRYKKMDAVVQQEGNRKLFTLKDFMLCSRKLPKMLICFWKKISSYCHGSDVFGYLN